MRLAVLGDIHGFKLLVPPWKLANKRLAGQVNLWVNRRRRFTHPMMPQLLEHMAGQQPDMLVLTGDITTSSLPEEFAMVRSWLEPLAKVLPKGVRYVPGNHDRYTGGSKRSKRVELAMGPGGAGWMPEAFPAREPINAGWQMISLDAARPRLTDSTGSLGMGQLAGLKTLLRQPAMTTNGKAADDQPTGTIILCHYPAILPDGKHEHDNHALVERTQMANLITKYLAGDASRQVLYLHGHIHEPWLDERVIAGEAGGSAGDEGGKLTLLNAGSPCYVSDDYPLGQGYWIVDLPEDGGGKVEAVHWSAEYKGELNHIMTQQNDLEECRWLPKKY